MSKDRYDERLDRLSEAAIYQLRLLAGFTNNLLAGKDTDKPD